MNLADLVYLGLVSYACISITLIGFRVVGKKHGEDPEYDRLHEGTLRHMRWIGPAMILMEYYRVLSR
jgi:hypothetical protein